MYENSLKLENSMKINGISMPYKKIQFLKGFPSNPVFMCACWILLGICLKQHSKNDPVRH